MRSSKNTPNRRRSRTVRLLVELTGEDHPKACTGRRLLHWGRAVRMGRLLPEGARGPIVLDPYAPTPLSAVDREAAEQGGLLVVDCSWNRLSSRGAFPAEEGRFRRAGSHRRLPMVVAANPQHYGRIAQLTTAEAFGAALYVLGWVPEAEQVLAGFAGAEEFFEINRIRLERYQRAAGPKEVLEAERTLFGGT
jgi:pre-rRNA-processing protein TSR3